MTRLNVQVIGGGEGSGLDKLSRGVTDPKVRKKILDKWSVLYFRSAQAAHVRNSVGGGKWRVLTDKTIKRKGSSKILIDTKQLLNATKPGNPNQVKDLNLSDFSVSLSIADTPYQHPAHLSPHKPRTLADLVGYHADDGRDILPLPSANIQGKMEQFALKELLRAFEGR